MMETFSKVAGFYIHFQDEKVRVLPCCEKALIYHVMGLCTFYGFVQVPEVVMSWNVKRLGLAREKRHMDMPVMLDFYRHLDAFLVAQRSNLAF